MPAVIGTEARAPPGPAGGAGDLDARDAAPAVPRHAPDVERAPDGNLLARRDVGDDRIDNHLRDRLVCVSHLRREVFDDRESVGRNAIGSLDPEIVEWLAYRVDRR